MRQVKRRTFSGHVCEQEIYSVADTSASAGRAAAAKAPRLRFQTEEQRAAHRDGIARRAHTRAFNANFGPTSIYSTLTFDDGHEVHEFKDAKRIRANYIRRLQRRYPDAVIFAYIGRGKSTARIHLHMVSEGIPREDIVAQWGMGDVRRMENLRESVTRKRDGREVGRDYEGLANYLYSHWTPEQGGHRYYKSRTARACDREDARECRRTYSEKHPPAAPRAPEGYEYHLSDVIVTPYGYMNFRYNLIRAVTPTGRERKYQPPTVILHDSEAPDAG